MIEKLSNAYAPSGREEEVRRIIIDELSDFYKDITVDNIGNLIVHKPGKKKVIAITAPMDEVGFLITHEKDVETVNTASLGSVNQNALHNIVVRDNYNRIYISSKNNKISDEITKLRNFEFDVIDKCKVEKLNNIFIADTLVFDTKYRSFDNLCVGKALERSLACSILSNLARSLTDSLYEYYFIFTAYNYCDKKGAYVATTDLKIDDLYNICCVNNEYNVELNKGPVIILRDKLLVSSEELTGKFNSNVFVTNDLVCEGGIFQKQYNTNNVVSIGIPVKYLYSPNEVANLNDVERTFDLLYQAVLP